MRIALSRTRRAWSCQPLLLGVLLAALALGAGCTTASTPSGGGDAAVTLDSSVPAPDASTPDAGREPEDASAPDAAAPNGCTCEEREDCAGCIAHLGLCCLDDPTYQGQARVLVASCQGRPACAACCNECVQKSCEQLIAEKACPNL